MLSRVSKRRISTRRENWPDRVKVLIEGTATHNRFVVTATVTYFYRFALQFCLWEFPEGSTGAEWRRFPDSFRNSKSFKTLFQVQLPCFYTWIMPSSHVTPRIFSLLQVWAVSTQWEKVFKSVNLPQIHRWMEELPSGGTLISGKRDVPYNSRVVYASKNNCSFSLTENYKSKIIIHVQKGLLSNKAARVLLLLPVLTSVLWVTKASPALMAHAWRIFSHTRQNPSVWIHVWAPQNTLFN